MDWKEAAPLIGVLATAFLGLIGALIAGKRRSAASEAATAAVPVAIAGAVAERGAADGLSLAIGQLTAEIMAYSAREERWRREDEDRDRDRDADDKRRHRELMEELRDMTKAIDKR